MNRLFLVFYFLFLFCYSEAQNLVPNYSFEQYDTCPNSIGQINHSLPWYSPTAGTPDYLNQCTSFSFIGVPNNQWGYQNPRTGIAYAGVGLYRVDTPSNVVEREYIQVMLSSSLVANRDYCVTFYVALAEFSNHTSSVVAITEIGMLFSNNPITTANWNPLIYTPQIKSPVGVFMSDTANWMQIPGTYTALGGERYITIGNFKSDSNTDTTGVGHLWGGQTAAYYYVDDVSVIDCANSVDELSDGLSIKLYPNPNNGQMQLNYKLNEGDNGELRIMDVTGRLIAKYNLLSTPNTLQISQTGLDNGIYLYQVLTNGRLVNSNKLIIAK